MTGGIALTVLVYLIQLVQIINHHAVGLGQACSRGISQPVQLLDGGAVAAMEMSYRIQQAGLFAVWRAEIDRTQALDDGFNGPAGHFIAMPVV